MGRWKQELWSARITCGCEEEKELKHLLEDETLILGGILNFKVEITRL